MPTQTVDLSSYTLEQLQEINHRVVDRIRQLQRDARFNFKPGDTVMFKTTRGMKITGTVERILQKNIRVTVQGTNWTVAPTLLTKVEG